MTYYYKKDSDTYHWHRECEHVPADVESNADWFVTETKPTGCNQCKSLDR